MHARGFTARQKTVENQNWATGLLGLRTVGPSRAVGRGPRAAGPSGRRTAGPSWAAGGGPLGRGPAFSKAPDIHYKPATDLSRVYRGILAYNHENNDFQGGTILNITNYENLFPIIYFDLTKQKWI